jgi:xanthine dehydrogenase YagS FAD-binding subunit
MIIFPKKIEEITKDGEIRAGGTDLQERRHKKISTGPLIDLRDLVGLDTIEASGAGLRLGTKVTIEAIANGGQGLAAYPGLIQTAAGLATPQIRHTATLGGNLLQRVRCWYYRSPEAKCLKKGGGACLAREGDHLFPLVSIWARVSRHTPPRWGWRSWHMRPPSSLRITRA